MNSNNKTRRKQQLNHISSTRKMRYVFILSTIAIFLTVATFTVEGFSISSRTSALPPPSPLLARSHQSLLPSSSIFTHHTLGSLALNQGSCTHDDSEMECNNKINRCSQMVQKGMKNLQRRIKRTTNQYTTQVVRFSMKSRGSLLALCAVVLFWLGAAGTYTPVSHGSSVSAPVGEISRNHILSSSLDEIIDEYVKDHMFDDDSYDPVESIYREAIDDKLKGTYPKELKETASSVLGQNVMKAEKKALGAGFSGGLVKAVGFLRQQGLSEIQAIALITGTFVIGAPSIAFAVFLSIVSQNKRSMNRLMKKRYGDTYTVDATAKEEEDIDVPDDDDDDDDDDDNDLNAVIRIISV